MVKKLLKIYYTLIDAILLTGDGKSMVSSILRMRMSKFPGRASRAGGGGGWWVQLLRPGWP